MKKVIFECTERMNQYKEEIEFEDNVTDEEIEEEYKDWVWEQIGDIFCWYHKGE